jgi:hypothetical protein
VEAFVLQPGVFEDLAGGCVPFSDIPDDPLDRAGVEEVVDEQAGGLGGDALPPERGVDLVVDLDSVNMITSLGE